MKFRIIKYLPFVIPLFIVGCGVYSFQGATIDYSTTKTISIDYFYNDTPLGPANLGQLFTEKLRDYYQQNTNLALVTEEGDLILEGRISRYVTHPVAPQASQDPDGVDFSSLTRLTITVQAAYTNTQDDTFDFDKSFSFFSDFDNSDNSFNDIEEQLIDEISQQITIDIFNASVANW